MTRTLSNGFTYEVVPNYFGKFNLYYKDSRMDKFMRSTMSFKTLEEAEKWFEKMEADYLAWQNKPAEKPLDCSRYYSEAPRGRYFGD